MKLRRTMSPVPAGARSQRGAIMIQFVMVSFGLMAILAVSIDVGMVRAVQGAMSNGTDVAALEGLRLRNALPPEYSNDDRDMFRRVGSQRLMALVYDEDMDLATRNTEYRFGMGGHISTGVGGASGTEDLSTAEGLAPSGLFEDVDAYNPTPVDGNVVELNAARNYRHGDMVAGNFTRQRPRLVGEEDADYKRTDFDTDLEDVEASADAFLVRARRGGRTESLDNVASISSGGPAVPAIFALGAMVGGDSNGGYNVRRDGYTVRSTSIAAAHPALAVGLAGPGGAYKGAIDLGTTPSGDHMTVAIDAFLGDCSLFDVGVDFTIRLRGGGNVVGPDTLLNPCGNLQNFGRALSIDDESKVVGFGGGLAPLPSGTALDLPVLALSIPRDVYYLPNYRTLSSGAVGEDAGYDAGCNALNPGSLTSDCFQVVGFSAIQVTNVLYVAGGLEPELQIRVVNLGAYIAPENASALDRTALSNYASANSSVQAAHDALIATGRHLQVPVLVR